MGFEYEDLKRLNFRNSGKIMVFCCQVFIGHAASGNVIGFWSCESVLWIFS